jgi:hypothetical protein
MFRSARAAHHCPRRFALSINNAEMQGYTTVFVVKLFSRISPVLPHHVPELQRSGRPAAVGYMRRGVSILLPRPPSPRQVPSSIREKRVLQTYV